VAGSPLLQVGVRPAGADRLPVHLAVVSDLDLDRGLRYSYQPAPGRPEAIV
jgi:hypothetical protein